MQQSTTKVLAKSIATAASPENIQKIANPVIDASYAWLNGETKTPKIVINIDKIKDSFVSTYSKALKVRAKTLPTCAYGQIPNLEDISNIDCIPSGTNVNQLIDEAIDILANYGLASISRTGIAAGFRGEKKLSEI